MKVAMLIAQRDFKDESVSVSKLMLEKWDISVSIASYYTRDCIGYHGAVYKPDIDAAYLNPDDFDALILIDGKGIDEFKLCDFRPLLDTVKLFSSRHKPIAAISNAVKILARANIISGVKVAVARDDESIRLVSLYRGVRSHSEMESDKGILTLSNPDMIYDFADLIITTLGAK